MDGHNFPNLALMKIANYHKKQGDTVEWVNFLERYDRVYMSKVFTFSPDIYTCIQSDKIIKGGTGYDFKIKLPTHIDEISPDYSIYPKFKDAYGFLTRGCIRNCPWCIVHKKEGDIRFYDSIDNILQDRKSAVLMDNNVLACDWGIKQINRIIELGCKVDFNQGLDVKLITEDIAIMLSKVKWLRYIRIACDTKSAIPDVKNAVENLLKHGIKPYRVFCYVLVKDIEDALYRIKYLRNLGVMPFAQPYRDFTNTPPAQNIKDLARWCNHRAIFKSCDFKDYRPRK